MQPESLLMIQKACIKLAVSIMLICISRVGKEKMDGRRFMGFW